MTFGVAAAAAALSASLVLLSMPPVGLWPVSSIALIPLLLSLRGGSTWRGGLAGWLFGVLVNLGGNYWGVDLLGRFAQLSIGHSAAIVLAVCVYQGLVWAVWGVVVSFLCRKTGRSWYLVAPLALASMEAMLPMIFPWQLAIVLWRAWPLTQVAEIGGPYAVSALIVLVNVAVLETGLAVLRRSWHVPHLVRVWIVVVALVGVGLLRAMYVADASARAPALRVGLMQPNLGLVSQAVRGRRGEAQIARMRSATAELHRRGAQLVVWPESSFPYLLDRRLSREPPHGSSWQLRPRSDDLRLLIGASTSPFDAAGAFDPAAPIYNSAILFGTEGGVRGVYDKLRPLVFGEYIPFADTFPAWAARLRRRLSDPATIAPGPAPDLLVDGDLRIAPLICYEDLLPGVVHQLARLGPNLLVGLANHAWFGDSAAAEQALALATFRTIETRRYLVRSTNTGVSSISDAVGRLRHRGPLLDVDAQRPPSPTLLLGTVRLLDTSAAGPHVAPLFPWLCGLALVLWTVRGLFFGRSRRTKGPAVGPYPPIS